MTICLFGLPGAGKTYLASRYGRETGYAVSSGPIRRRRRYWLGLRYTARHPYLVASVLIKVVRENHSRRKLLFYKVHNLFMSALAREEQVRERLNSIVDEGLLQLLLSIYERRITKAEAKACLQNIVRRNDRIWLVEADKNLRLERMHIRKRIPRSEHGLDYMYSWMAVSEHNYEIFKEVIQEQCECRIICTGDDVQSRAVKPGSVTRGGPTARTEVPREDPMARIFASADRRI